MEIRKWLTIFLTVTVIAVVTLSANWGTSLADTNPTGPQQYPAHSDALSGVGGAALAAPLAAVAPTLGAAWSFAVLAHETVTNTGKTLIGGDLGLHPGTSITGFPPGQVKGTIHATDAVALQAQKDVITAYDALASQPCTTTFDAPTDLGGKTLVPGVYCFKSSAGLTGVLTLNGGPEDAWVFKIGSAITTAPDSSVVFTGGESCNVFWQVTSSATLDTNTKFVGNILALVSITLNTTASLDGRALARTGAVTLDSNDVSFKTCAIAATKTAIAATKTAAAAATKTMAAKQTEAARPTATFTPTAIPLRLPGTGFAPGVNTILSKQPVDLAYASLGDLWLEIPRLGVQKSIVGVPQVNGNWDVSWLGNNAGWLNGTAFPTWAGNSVLTGHVYEANGDPGPFVDLDTLVYGDQVIVHAWGDQYIYEVRSLSKVTPNSVSSVIKHEDFPWLTLITCNGYKETTNSYQYRIVVRAVQVEIK